MFFDRLSELPGFFLELLTLSDQNFHQLLGLLMVVLLLRLFGPIHRMMSRELFKRNEIVDLAEEKNCTEYDIFILAHQFFYGSAQPEKIQRDFIIYLENWPDNYVLPFYLRNYLAERQRDNSDSLSDHAVDNSKKGKEKLPAGFLL